MIPTLILLNGASSAGKTTIARALQQLSSTPCFHAQIDAFAKMLPPSEMGRCVLEASGAFAGKAVHAFHTAVVALVRDGETVIVDHVLGEDRLWVQDLIGMSSDIRVLVVGVHCDLPALCERERNRTDREGFEDIAVRQHHRVHDALCYDVEVDTTHAGPEDCARKILDAMESPILNAWGNILQKWSATDCADAKAPSPRKGCLQIYTGDGKGKTTAATGLAVRSAGAGLRVFIGQFIKGKDSHEMAVLRERFPEISIEQFGEGRFIRGKPTPADIEGARVGLERLRSALSSDDYDVVIADEANGALNAGIITLAELLSLVDSRPPHVELVITGRSARPELVERAELVTEMVKVKHCFDAGIPAREGIEY